MKKITPNEAARTLSALGASKGGKARAKKLSPERRKEIAKKAGNARWQKGKVRFLVIPGFVISRSDGERHHVRGKQLMELYRVDPRECLELSEHIPLDRRSPPPPGYTWEYLYSLVHLTPRHDGDYSQFWL